MSDPLGLTHPSVPPLTRNFVSLDETGPFDAAALANAYDVTDANLHQEMLSGVTEKDHNPRAFADDPLAWWTPERADWYLKKQAAIDAEIALIHQNAAKMVAKLEKEKARRAAWFGPSFEQWHRDRVEQTGKTVRYLHGTVAMVQRKAALVIENAMVLREWAAQNCPGVIKRETVEKVSLDMAAIKKQYELTGEVPDGCEIVDPHLSVSIKPNKGEE